jgi:hypothetical protein
LGIQFLRRAKIVEGRTPGVWDLYAEPPGQSPLQEGAETAVTMPEMTGHVAETVGHDARN